jgi:NAD(P)-dependent dehydrogenase (short-subunit alcohol dehydrogenase family)
MTAPVVLITGALAGIGRATAQAFARQGARLVVSGRRDDAGTPEEIAQAIVWLASDHAGFLTGQVVDVNGGKTAF